MIISFYLFQSLYLICFSSLIIVTVTSSTVLNKLVIVGILVLLLILEVGGEFFSILQFIIWLFWVYPFSGQGNSCY